MSGRFAVFFLVFLLLAPEPGWSAPGISAHYEEIDGPRVTLVVEIGAPPPTMIIIDQEIPAGLTLRSASPPFNKLGGDRSTAKWLLKDVEPGRQRIVMQFSGPVDPKELRSELRFRIKGAESSAMITVTP